MGRPVSERKAIEWQDRLARFDGDSRTVAKFCFEEGCSTQAFYYWRERLQMQRRQATATFPLTTPSSWRCVTSSRCVIANGWMSTACRWSDTSERESSLNDCLIFQSVRRIGDGGRCESRRAQKQSQGLCMINIPMLPYMYCLLCIQILEVY